MTGYVVLLLALSGCGVVTRRPIPTTYTPDMNFGQVVREIRLEGNEYTRSSVILATMETEVGDIYTVESAEIDSNRLEQLGVFTGVQFATTPVQDGVVLIIRMEELSPYIPTISLALTQENGLEIGPGVSSSNLFGNGTKASVYARFGGATNFGIRYADPWRLADDWWACCYEIEYFHRERVNDLDNFEEGSDEVFFQYLYFRNARIHFGPRVTLLSLKAEPDSAGNIPDVMFSPDGRDQILGLGVVAEYDTRDQISYPTGGWFLQVSAVQSIGLTEPAADYFRLEADWRLYRLLSGPHSLAFYSLASVTDGEMGVSVPYHQDLHIGGTNSVRGWPLGSRVGKSQWLNTAEYWWNIVPMEAFQASFIRWAMGLQLAAFADAGTVWNDVDEIGGNWIIGGGVGARLTIPQIGIVRFDVAMGQLDPEFSLYMQIGGSEKAIAQKKRVR